MELKKLSVSTDGKKIVKDLDLKVIPGETHIIMGPNGSGKSTLANALLGHPKYKVEGSILLDGNELKDKSPDFRAKKGLYLSMQYAPEIPGVTVAHFLRTAVRSVSGEDKNPLAFHEELLSQMKKLSMDQSFATRYINTGFSGGEKKKADILQLLMLNPKYAVLDETDSGLDVDALKIVSEGIKIYKQNKDKGLLIITHYNRILEYVTPDFVHIMIGGRIVQSGGKELAEKIEKNGYAGF